MEIVCISFTHIIFLGLRKIIGETVGLHLTFKIRATYSKTLSSATGKDEIILKVDCEIQLKNVLLPLELVILVHLIQMEWKITTLMVILQ